MRDNQIMEVVEHVVPLRFGISMAIVPLVKQSYVDVLLNVEMV